MRLSILFILGLVICVSTSFGQSHDDSAKVAAYRRTTIEFLKKHNIPSPDIKYITLKYVATVEKANPDKKTIPAPKNLAKPDQKFLKGKVLTAEQWSGYVYNVSNDGTTFTYYTSCLVQPPNGPYTCASSAVASIQQAGFCGQFTQYYVVINE